MKICFVVRNLYKGGVRRFIENVLIQIDSLNYSNYEIYIIHNEKNFHLKLKNCKHYYIKTRNKFLFDYIYSLQKIIHINPDVIIYPKNIIPLPHLFLQISKMTIIHDLGYFEKNQSFYPFFDTLYMRIFMKLSCKCSSKVFAISNFTKKDIMKKFGINPNKIHVILEGVGSNFKKINLKSIKKSILINSTILDTKTPFILYSGSIDPRKNTLRLIKAFRSIKSKIPHNLVLVGSCNTNSTYYKNIIKIINKDNRIKILGYISEDELIKLYNLADVYVYPSLYEGFGLPILEAQSCECPVITSNITSMPEVAGESALLVNPYNTNELKLALLKVVNDNNIKKNLIDKGRLNVNRFSWEKTANKILDRCKSK